MRILIVDDDRGLLSQLQQVLADLRYVVETAVDGEEALDKIFSAPFDLIVMDIMMPKLDGLDVLQKLRKSGVDTPVIMLTAKGDVDDKIKGLDRGADDYIAKPFSLDELLARMRALLRRSGGNTDSVISVRSLELDTVKRVVKVAGKPVDLTSREFSILEFLMHNRNRAVSRFNLTEHVWGDDFDPFSMSNFVDVHMKNLRHKIADGSSDTLIRTVRGVGYIIED